MNEQGGPGSVHIVTEKRLRTMSSQMRGNSFYSGSTHIMVRLDQGSLSAPSQIVECLEEPIAASSIVPMFFVSERARQDVKVALIGQGPDELFGGYKRHLGVHYGEWWRWLPAGLRSSVGFAIDRLLAMKH